MKVFYQRTYSIAPYLTERIGFEIEAPDDCQDPAAEVATLKELCDKAHKELNPNLEEMKGTHVVPVQEEVVSIKPILRSREDVIKSHLLTINECETLRNLEMFYPMVNRENEPVLTEAYEAKKKELVKPIVEDIMKRTEALTKK